MHSYPHPSIPLTAYGLLSGRAYITAWYKHKARFVFKCPPQAGAAGRSNLRVERQKLAHQGDPTDDMAHISRVIRKSVGSDWEVFKIYHGCQVFQSSQVVESVNALYICNS